MKKILVIFFFGIVSLLNYIFFFTLPLFAQEVDTAWVRRYNGPANDFDVAQGVAVDASGNVYVTGYSVGLGTSEDYVTIKYYPDGDTAWVRRYNGPGNSIDRAHAITIDGLGNVYVTGLGDGGNYTTIKYYSNGDTAWVRGYSGSSVDEAYAITVDDFGNVYVIGETYADGQSMNYATIKYYPDGETAWVRTYNYDYDTPFDILVDDSGNVYVTGNAGTIKYDNNGNQLWIELWDGWDIAMDSSGYIYIAGCRWNGTDLDYITVKSYPNGDTAWVRIYQGPGSSDDDAYAIAIDSSENVYVTGNSGTLKYNSYGDQLWLIPEAGLDIAVDDSGSVYVSGFSGTKKYDTDGNQIWFASWGGDMTLDTSDNVYVCSSIYESGTSFDIATIKYVQKTVYLFLGDVNGDGQVTVSDIVYLINYLFKSGPEPVPVPGLLVGDANCDGKITVTDVVYLINYLFKSGLPPAC